MVGMVDTVYSMIMLLEKGTGLIAHLSLFPVCFS